MIDFLMISTRSTKRGVIEIYPKFIIKRSSDLMIRGGDFYAIWIEEKGLWSTDEHDALQLIDNELDAYAKANRSKFDGDIRVLHMWDAETGMVDKWHKYCQKQMRDRFVMLDERLIFSNHETVKKDYASRKLTYPLEPTETPAYDKLMSTLYSPEERQKLEWAIGAVVTGDSTKIQKFFVLYGAAGTGKSTVLNIIQMLFEGYYSVFDARALGSTSNNFALEAFKTNPLVAIQHDGDLSRIEDNTRLNSLVSHELMTVNEKFKNTYTSQFKSFLFMGTNKPVKITDSRSGLIRRLIDISPSGNTLPTKEYDRAMKQVKFELGGIAYHCREVYLSNPGVYDSYIPSLMLGASNDFYNFVVDSYHIFKKEDGVSQQIAWEMYKSYCDEAKVPFPYPKRTFKEELKNYFRDYKERFSMEDGSRVRSYYIGFKTEKFEDPRLHEDIPVAEERRIQFEKTTSAFDILASSYSAQYASKQETPITAWDNVTTTLSDLDSHKLHYVRVPENHIVIDFDILGDDGTKSFERNLEEASKWPETYAELSKSGSGIHLHYIYTGDVSTLSRVYADEIEVKIFTGKSSLRRKLTKCNSLPIATISSGLPLKGDTKMVNFDAVMSERGLRTLIKRNLNKEIHANTKPSIDFIKKILDDAYASGMAYDVTTLRNAVVIFAADSTNNADYCLQQVQEMKFASDSPSENVVDESKPVIFYDVEVYPNLLLVCWKPKGKDKKVKRMYNPTPSEVEELMHFNLIGFNNRRYDNHILYARMLGYSNTQLFDLSQKIINKSKNAFFGEAYNLSYTDIYDFSNEKMSLKKWQIKLGIHHKELGIPWDQPVPEGLWEKIGDYCENDVISTEAVFEAREADFIARKILAEIANMSVNDTTNELTAKIIFGNNRTPQAQFNYRNLGGNPEDKLPYSRSTILTDGTLYSEYGDEFTVFDSKNRPVFPGYTFDRGVSMYRGEKVGEGGYVYAEPGMYSNVAVLDIASMHPRSVIAETLFGEAYTKRFEELVDARIAVKHKDFVLARTLLGGVLAPYLNDEIASMLAFALKIAINSVYGLTSASFANIFKDQRNIDNIVAKRGALFMINLKHEVQSRGFTVAHIKTDSIKIPNASLEIIDFVQNYGKQYGYTFEHETTYKKMCLVNNAVYIAKEQDGSWTAVGAQFQVPYVFKKLFSKERLEFSDLCETKAVTTAIYLDMNENLPTTDEEEGHDRIFVGKVGLFCPMKEGKGGGVLLREKETNGVKGYSAVTGTKGYRWLEAEMVSALNKQKDIDRSYYDRMVDDAVETISKYGDFEWFIADDMELQKVA